MNAQPNTSVYLLEQELEALIHVNIKDYVHQLIYALSRFIKKITSGSLNIHRSDNKLFFVDASYRYNQPESYTRNYIRYRLDDFSVYWSKANLGKIATTDLVAAHLNLNNASSRKPYELLNTGMLSAMSPGNEDVSLNKEALAKIILKPVMPTIEFSTAYSNEEYFEQIYDTPIYRHHCISHDMPHSISVSYLIPGTTGTHFVLYLHSAERHAFFTESDVRFIQKVSPLFYYHWCKKFNFPHQVAWMDWKITKFGIEHSFTFTETEVLKALIGSNPFTTGSGAGTSTHAKRIAQVCNMPVATCNQQPATSNQHLKKMYHKAKVNDKADLLQRFIWFV